MFVRRRNFRGPAKDPFAAILVLILLVLLGIHFTKPFVVSSYLDSNTVAKQAVPAYSGVIQTPVEIGPLGNASDTLLLRISFRFMPTVGNGYPNLLQTGPENEGIRLELNDRVLALVVGDAYKPLQVTIVSTDVSPGEWHSLQLSAIRGQYIDVILDGIRTRASDDFSRFSSSNTRVGIGYDDARKFHGDIADIHVASGAEGLLFRMLLAPDKYFFYNLVLILLLLSQRWMAYNFPGRDDVLYAAAFKDRLRLGCRNLAIPSLTISLLLSISGIIYFFAFNHFNDVYKITRFDILAGFKTLPGARPFKAEFLIFVLLEMTLVGAIGCTWFGASLTQWRPRARQITFASMTLCILPIFLALLIDYRVSRSMFALALFPAAVILSTRRHFWQFIPNVALAYVISFAVFIFQLPTHILMSVRTRVHRARLVALTKYRGWAVVVAGLALAALLSSPIFTSWYPISLPNDYMELSDSILIDAATEKIPVDRKQMVQCLLSSAQPTSLGTLANVPQCPPGVLIGDQNRAEISSALLVSSAWQSEPGRLLFHHSYLYVPAKHLMTYGLDGEVPYLYGFGNTIFHAALMFAAGGPSLTHYLETFPIAEFTGILAAAALTFFITGSQLAAFCAFLLSLSAFYLISFVPVFLAASFSPLRLFGLAVQIGAMAFFSKSRSPVRFVLLPISAAFSLFWNREFGQIGAIGQALLIFAPAFEMRFRDRLILLTSLFACVGLASIYPGTSHNIVNTVELSFFNISMQSMAKRDVAWFLLYVATAHIVLFALSTMFHARERALRVALVPVLALSLTKYVYNPAAPHLYIMCTLLWPLMLIYIPWIPARSSAGRRIFLPQPLPFAIAVATIILATQVGFDYGAGASDFRARFVDPFQQKNWTQLNETLPTVAPEAPISARVEAIRSQLRPGDKMLLLSPFDHVLNFYANPQSYCGHFDLFTNFATSAVADKVRDCVANAKSLLIVYDRALEIPCPTDSLEAQPLCRQKSQMKYNLTAFRDLIMPLVHFTASDDNLIFYRRDVETAGK
jgi:hypothetical protein